MFKKINTEEMTITGNFDALAEALENIKSDPSRIHHYQNNQSSKTTLSIKGQGNGTVKVERNGVASIYSGSKATYKPDSGNLYIDGKLVSDNQNNNQSNYQYQSQVLPHANLFGRVTKSNDETENKVITHTSINIKPKKPG